MQSRTIGDTKVSAIGLGAMPLSSPSPVEQERAIATVHAALDAGITLIDTADAYAPDEHSVGHNERVIARALATWPVDTSYVLVATKGGHTRTPGGGWGLDGSPEHLRRACDASLRALGVSAIGLYQYHRPDPSVPYAESIGALAELRQAGKIRLVGISNASIEQIDIAREVLGEGGLASVQNEFSPRFRSSERELRHCTHHDIAFLPWSPLGGAGGARDLGDRIAPFAEIAGELGASAQQVALAWLLAKSPIVIPIPGSTRPVTARESAAAAELVLSDDQLARLDATA
jgi:aryl-alcohol dehydrogenase-like predicted oxidoreductase